MRQSNQLHEQRRREEKFTPLAAILLLLLSSHCAEKPAPPPPPAAPPPPPAAPPPTTAEARTIVESSPVFSEYQFTQAGYTLPTQRSAMHAPAREVADQLAQAKWIAFDGAGNLILTPKAKSDRRFLLRPNGSLDIVPLAKKEFLAVDEVARDTDGAPLVHFRWQWVPNDILSNNRSATLRDRYAGEQRGAAKLMREGDGWSVLRITPSK